MTTKSRIALTVAALSAALAVGCTKAPAFTAEDETAVRAFFDGTVKNVNAGNFEAWAAQFADDAVFQPANGQTVTGRAAILAWGKALPPMEHMVFSNVKVSGEGNMAWGTSHYAIKMTGVPADTGKQLVVFKRSADGKWGIVAGGFNSDLPLPTPAASKAAPASKTAGKAPAKAKAPSKAPAKVPTKTTKKGGHPSSMSGT